MQPQGRSAVCTANLRTDIMDFRGFDSSIILIIRGGIPRPTGDFPESLSQAILVGIILVGRLGVSYTPHSNNCNNNKKNSNINNNNNNNNSDKSNRSNNENVNDSN